MKTIILTFMLIVCASYHVKNDGLQGVICFEADFNTGDDVTELGFRYSGNTTVEIVSGNLLDPTPIAKFFLNRFEDEVPYRTLSDTEVIVLAYEEWGGIA